MAFLKFNKSELVNLAYSLKREIICANKTEVIAFSFIFIGALMPLCSMIVGEFYAPKGLDFLLCEFKMPDLKAWAIIAVMGILGIIFGGLILVADKK